MALDVIGAVVSLDSLKLSRNRRTGQEVWHIFLLATTLVILILATQLAMRSVIIIDPSEIHVKAVLWAKRAEEFGVPKGTIVAFRRAEVEGDGEGG